MSKKLRYGTTGFFFTSQNGNLQRWKQLHLHLNLSQFQRDRTFHFKEDGILKDEERTLTNWLMQYNQTLNSKLSTLHLMSKSNVHFIKACDYGFVCFLSGLTGLRCQYCVLQHLSKRQKQKVEKMFSALRRLTNDSWSRVLILSPVQRQTERISEIPADASQSWWLEK